MNSDEAEAKTREWLESGDASIVYLDAVEALLQFHEQNKALIADLHKRNEDLQSQLDGKL